MPPIPTHPTGLASDPPRTTGTHRRRPRGRRRSWSNIIEIKAANPDCLLFYRMGDFYELFFDDAEIASRALGIVLTKRGKHLGRDIPMCGVPIHRADEYLHRLIALGHRVAVCEQIEDPAAARKRGAKSVVRRDVVRLVTPGTLTEDTLLDARRNNYLLAIARARASSSGDAAASRSPGSTSRPASSASPNATARGLAAELARLEPSEIIVSDALYADADLAPFLRSLPAVTPLTRDVFDGATAERRLSSYFAVATSDAFGALSRLELTAAAACVTYVERTQLGQRPPLSPPVREARRRDARDRPGDPQQSRTGAHARRRAARLAARRHRPHRDRGRLAAAGAAAGGAADRSGCDRAAARCGGAFRRRRRPARQRARAAERRARSRARAGAAGGRAAAARATSPRSATASRRPPSLAARARRAGDAIPAEVARGRRRALRRPDAAIAQRACGGARRRAAAAQARRRLRARGLRRARSTRRARCATNRAA